MKPRLPISLVFLLLWIPTQAQELFVRTQLKRKSVKGQEIIRSVRIFTSGSGKTPIVLINKDKLPDKGNEWVIFSGSGGMVNFKRDKFMPSLWAKAFLGQQSAEVHQIQHEERASYTWKIATRSDTLYLGEFPSSLKVEALPKLYKIYTQETIPEDQTPAMKPRKVQLPLLQFSTTESSKLGLSIQETGQISDYSYLSKILAAFLATLEMNSRTQAAD